MVLYIRDAITDAKQVSPLASFPVLGCRFHLGRTARRPCSRKAALSLATDLPVTSAEYSDPKCGDAAMWSRIAGFLAGD